MHYGEYGEVTPVITVMEAAMSTQRPSDTDPDTHCEWCGAAFDPANQTAIEIPHTKDQPIDPEPPTHCEWCGAPYPTPDEPSPA